MKNDNQIEFMAHCIATAKEGAWIDTRSWTAGDLEQATNRAKQMRARMGKAPMDVTKASILDTAKTAVADRGLNYGKPEDNFQRIADRWRTHLKNRFGIDVPIDPASVAMMMSDMKIARLENDPTHMDSWVDIAGYAACGGEIAGTAKKEA